MLRAKPVPGAYLDLSLTSTGLGWERDGLQPDLDHVDEAPHQSSEPVRRRHHWYGDDQVHGGQPAPCVGNRHDHRAESSDRDDSNYHDLQYYATSTGPPKGPYTPVTPFRVCDTRPAAPGIVIQPVRQGSTGAGSGPIGSGCHAGYHCRQLRWPARDRRHGSGRQRHGDRTDQGDVPHAVSRMATPSTTSNLNPAGRRRSVANLVEVGVSTRGQDRRLQRGRNDQRRGGHRGLCLAQRPRVSSPEPATVRICDTRATGRRRCTNRCNTGWRIADRAAAPP